MRAHNFRLFVPIKMFQHGWCVCVLCVVCLFVFRVYRVISFSNKLQNESADKLELNQNGEYFARTPIAESTTKTLCVCGSYLCA